MAQQMYLGPDYRGLVRFMTFANSIPVGLQAVVAGSADVQLLLVPLASSAIVQAAISQPGTPEHDAYARLAGAPPQTTQAPQSTGSAGSIYDKPNPSRQLKSDGLTVVNPADGINPDGSVNTKVAGPLPAGGNKIGSVDAVLTGSIVAVDSAGNVAAQQVREYRGKSSDVKPSTGVPLYSTFMEMDTQNIYYWNGTSWAVM